MEVTILGSGTIAPSLDRNPSGLAVHVANQWILVDIGPGIMRRMCEANIDMRWIDVILITHFHPDHVSDLAAFLFACNYAHYTPREEPFYTVGPMGLEQFLDGLVEVYGHWIVPSGNRRIGVELDADGPDSFTLGDLVIRSMPAAHSSPSLSYRIEADGVSLTVSGDTDVSENLVTLARNTDLLICESSFPDAMKCAGHLVASEAGTIARKAEAKRLVLTHFYPPCEDTDVVEEASRSFSGEILKARDLMVMKV